jgi:hypothetical protein
MLKHTLTAAALTAALATPAFAQQPPKSDGGTQPVQVQSVPGQTAGDGERFVQNQHATDWRGSKLIGATVYGPDNASIGNINDVLIDNNGKLRAVVIGVGGFLGVGEKDVAMPFETLKIVRKPESSSIDKVTVSYSKDDLKNAPKFAWYEPGPSQTTGSGVSDKIRNLNPMSDQKK